MTLGLFVCYIVDINVIAGGTIMQFNCKTNDIVYKIFRNEEAVYIKEFVVIECENRNLICQDEDGNYYKFNYFEDNLIIDKSVVDELFLLYKKDYVSFKEKYSDKSINNENNFEEGTLEENVADSAPVYKDSKKSYTGIFDTIEENNSNSHQLSGNRMNDKLYSGKKERIETNKTTEPVIDSKKIKDIILSSSSKRTTSQDTSKLMPKTVKVGSKVGLLYAGDDEVCYYTIVKDEYSIVPKFASGRRRNKIIAEKQSKGSDISKNEITENSPIAKAIIGKSRGERFSIEVRGSKVSGNIVYID